MGPIISLSGFYFGKKENDIRTTSEKKEIIERRLDSFFVLIITDKSTLVN